MQLTPNPARVGAIRREAEQVPFAMPTLYRSKDTLGVEEYTLEGRKWWKLPVDGDVGVTDPPGSDIIETAF